MKKINIALSTFIVSGLLAFATTISSAHFNEIRASGGHTSSCDWSHYEEIAPTFEKSGVKEYWICCNHNQDGPVFSMPSVGTITNRVHPSGFIDTISPSDSRYLAPYETEITFNDGVLPSYISSVRGVSSLTIVDNEGIDGSKALKIVNSSWNYAVKIARSYLDAAFADPSVVAVNFYAKSNVATNDFRRLSKGSGVCYEANQSGYGIDNTYKEFSYTRAYYETDLETDSIFYGGAAIGTMIYIDNIHLVKESLTTNGFENGRIAATDLGNFTIYTAGHSSIGVDNYIAPTPHFKSLSSAEIITSYGYDYDIKSEGIRSLRLTKVNGYVAFYFPSSIYSTLGENDYVSIDIFSSVGANANDTAGNFLDGFSNTMVQTKNANGWQTYNFIKGKNITNDGRFLIIQGTTAGNWYFDNIKVHTANVDTNPDLNLSEVFISGGETSVEINTNRDVDTIAGVKLDDTVLAPVNNTRNVFINPNKRIAIKRTLVSDGEHIVEISYLNRGTLYTERKYLTFTTIQIEAAKTLSINYGDADYYTLSGYTGIYRISCGNKEVPFEVSGSSLLIPNSALVELLPTISGAKQSGTVNLILRNVTTTYKLPMNITVTGTNNVKTLPTFDGGQIPLHAYSSSDSTTSNSNVASKINDLTMGQYFATGLNIWYEQALHVGATTSTLSTGVQHLLNTALTNGKKVLLADDAFNNLSRETTSLLGRSFTLNGGTYTFNSEADIDRFTEQRLSLYINYPSCYGVNVGDEQKYAQLGGGYRDIMHSLHRVLKKLNREDFYINSNLLPMSADSTYIYDDEVAPEIDYKNYTKNHMANQVALYEQYLERYVEASGNSYIQYDLYPFTSNDKGWKYESKGLDLFSIQNLLVAGKIAKKYNLDLYVVTQSLMYYGTRTISPLDIAWMNNVLLAFGVKHISYFVYQCRSITGTENWLEDSTFLDMSGNKNNMYYYMTGMISQINNFSNTYMDFDYEWSNLYKYNYSYSSSQCYSAAKKLMDEYYNSTYGNLSNVTTSRDWTLVTGLKHKDSDMKMYAVQNVYNNFANELLQTVKLTFNKTYSYAIVYEQGLPRIVNMNAKTLSLKLSAGHAAFVIPVE